MRVCGDGRSIPSKHRRDEQGEEERKDEQVRNLLHPGSSHPLPGKFLSQFGVLMPTVGRDECERLLVELGGY